MMTQNPSQLPQVQPILLTATASDARTEPFSEILNRPRVSSPCQHSD